MTDRNKNEGSGLVGLVVRLIMSMLVIALTNILTPGMSTSGGFLNLALIAIIIAIVDFIISKLLSASKAAKGITGFLVMALVLYISGMVLKGFKVTILGALIGGLVYGIVDAIIPGKRL